MTDFRYRRVSYVAVGTPDVERSANFLIDLVGLMEGAEAGRSDVRFLRCTDGHHDVMIMKSATPGIARISFEMESEKDLDATRAHLKAEGVAVEDVGERELAFLGINRAVRIVEPTSGLNMEFMHGMETMDTPFAPTLAKIDMLGHIVVGTPDPKAMSAFLTEKLNFLVSDSGPGGGLLRPFPTANHHSLGLVRMPFNRIAHIAFMVEAYDDIGMAVPRFKKHEVPMVFGPGFHPASGSNFLYFLDPDGMTWEYTFGMEQFPEHDPRDARELNFGNGDSWGNIADPRMGKIGDILALEELVA